MVTNLTRAALVVVAFALCSSAASADEVIRPSPVARAASTLNPTNWRMPQFLKMPKFSGIFPAKEEKARIRKKKDSFVDEVSQTASRSWQRTKETLSPKNLNPIRFMPASAKKPSKSNDEPGFFGSLFAPPTQPKNAETVNDFLGQAKPRG